MKKSSLLSAILLVIASTPASAQPVRSGTRIELMTAAACGRVGNQFWSSGGAGVAEEGLADAPFSNPASLNPRALTLTFEAGKRSTADWLYDIEYDGQWIVPAYASVALPEGGWSLSLGYANFFSADFSISGIPVTTEQFPEGTGQTFDYERTVRAHAFFGSASYRAAEGLSVGLTMGLDVVNAGERVLEVTAKGDGYGVVAVAGAMFIPSPSISFGSKITIASTVNMEQRFFARSYLSDSSVRNSNIQYLPETYLYRLAFPWMAEAGVDWRLFPRIQLLASVEYQRWSAISDYLENRWQLHIGAAISFPSGTSTRIGFFTQADPNSSLHPYMNENFLTAGFEFSPVEHIGLTASILDSHLFSNSDALPGFGGSSHNFRQTYGSVGGTYSF